MIVSSRQVDVSDSSREQQQLPLSDIETMHLAEQPSIFLAIPPELRNEIYLHVFARTSPTSPPAPDDINNSDNNHHTTNPLSLALEQSTHRAPYPTPNTSNPHLHVLQTCAQIHREASLIALSEATFHVSNEATDPEHFTTLLNRLTPTKQSAIRHVTLTARIAQLRQLNESWRGLPFGHEGLRLDTLTVVPKKVEASPTAYAEVADLSQSHTLAYVLAETLKRLRHVRVVQVRNCSGCFNGTVWQLVYRGLVYRLWRWGGEKCGLRVECGRDEGDGEEWIRVWLGREAEECLRGFEVGEEVVRMVGGREALPETELVGF